MLHKQEHLQIYAHECRQNGEVEAIDHTSCLHFREREPPVLFSISKRLHRLSFHWLLFNSGQVTYQVLLRLKILKTSSVEQT